MGGALGPPAQLPWYRPAPPTNQCDQALGVAPHCLSRWPWIGVSGQDWEGALEVHAGLPGRPRLLPHHPSPLPQLGGCGILGVGIWLAATQGNFATLSSSFPSLSAANLLIVTGTFIMAIGFVGCIGAIKENKCLLLTVSAGGPWGAGHRLPLRLHLQGCGLL